MKDEMAKSEEQNWPKKRKREMSKQGELERSKSWLIKARVGVTAVRVRQGPGTV